ncbi:MAG: hypothetical protein DMF67_09575 [Acidobacteria bacterium]|nr:MAG: hypothetical protein DMF67_09575 [Acidobacteriota bacterium]
MSFWESSLEYDLFESMRRHLARVLAVEGREEIEAERAALYVMQGLREVPKLLNALASSNTPDGETRDILDLVLVNAASLERARTLLLGLDDQVAD